jgi:hypothetical protein
MYQIFHGISGGLGYVGNLASKMLNGDRVIIAQTQKRKTPILLSEVYLALGQ